MAQAVFESVVEQPIRVMLVDDHAVVREGYRRLLQTEGDMCVVAEAKSADDGAQVLEEHATQVDVLVLDISMHGRSGLDFLREVRLRWPHIGVLVFSMHDNPTLVSQAIRTGATGYVTKSSPPEDLIQAVRFVARLEPVLSSDVAVALNISRRQTSDQAPAAHLSLTAKEMEVLRHVVSGFSLEGIGERLGMSPKTVANHQSNIRSKLGVTNAVDLLRYVQQNRLFPDEFA